MTIYTKGYIPQTLEEVITYLDEQGYRLEEAFTTFELDQLENVDLTGLVDGNTLVYDIADGLWKPGAGGGGGSALEVEDDGTSLSTAVTKFNFIGFQVSEPTADEIQISFGVAAASNEYCPNYDYSRVDDNEFTVDLVDAENLFSVGRRVKFAKAGVDTFGTVTAVDYDVTSADDTHVTLAMEGVDTVPTDPFDACLVSSATGWSPIAGDPFSGGAINALATGPISGTQYWVAVGDDGKFAISDDAGATWSLLTTVTTEHLNCVTYDTTNETFWAGGDGGVLVSTTNGTSVVEDTTSIPALTGSDNYNINAITYSETSDVVFLLYNDDNAGFKSAASVDQGTSWTDYAATSGTLLSPFALSVNWNGATTRSTDFTISRSSGSLLLNATPYTDTSWGLGISAGGPCGVILEFWDSGLGANVEIFGRETGVIQGNVQWTGDDSTTFSNRWNDMAYSPLHARVVGVGENQQMGYWDRANRAVANSWVTISSGFDPLANIKSIKWNPTDGVFVAVADNGQICRSTNGIN